MVWDLLANFALSKIGAIGIVGLMVAGGVAALILNAPKWIAIALFVAAGGHAYTGVVHQRGYEAGYRSGYVDGDLVGAARGQRICEARVAAERERQRLIKEAMLTVSEARADALEAGIAARNTEIAEYAKELASRPRKPECDPRFSDRDVEWLQRILRTGR